MRRKVPRVPEVPCGQLRGTFHRQAIQARVATVNTLTGPQASCFACGCAVNSAKHFGYPACARRVFGPAFSRHVGVVIPAAGGGRPPMRPGGPDGRWRRLAFSGFVVEGASMRSPKVMQVLKGLAVMVVAMTIASSASAQTFTGGLRGAVRDANGVVPGVTV